MIKSPCRAKDANTCRYHAPSAAKAIKQAYELAEKKISAATNITEYATLSDAALELKGVYDATDEGFNSLKRLRQDMMSNPANFKGLIETNERLAKARIARREERQSGPATDVIVIQRQDMSQYLEGLRSKVLEGNSDHFLNILDGYKRSLDDAMFNDNAYDFAKLNNEVIDNMLDRSSSLDWFDQEKQKQFEDNLRSQRIVGRVYAPNISFNKLTSPATSGTFNTPDVYEVS